MNIVKVTHIIRTLRDIGRERMFSTGAYLNQRCKRTVDLLEQFDHNGFKEDDVEARILAFFKDWLSCMYPDNQQEILQYNYHKLDEQALIHISVLKIVAEGYQGEGVKEDAKKICTALLVACNNALNPPAPKVEERRTGHLSVVPNTGIGK